MLQCKVVNTHSKHLHKTTGFLHLGWEFLTKSIVSTKVNTIDCTRKIIFRIFEASGLVLAKVF